MPSIAFSPPCQASWRKEKPLAWAAQEQPPLSGLWRLIDTRYWLVHTAYAATPRFFDGIRQRYEEVHLVLRCYFRLGISIMMLQWINAIDEFRVTWCAVWSRLDRSFLKQYDALEVLISSHTGAQIAAAMIEYYAFSLLLRAGFNVSAATPHGPLDGRNFAGGIIFFRIACARLAIFTFAL